METSVLIYSLFKKQKPKDLKFSRKLNSNLKLKIKNIDNPSYHYESDYANNFLSPDIVVLNFFGRSGTGLLHSLIDGHPEVSTLPSIYFNQFFNHTTWNEDIISAGWDHVVNRFMQTYEVLFDASTNTPFQTPSGEIINNLGKSEGLTTLGEGRDEVLTVDKTLFREELTRLMLKFETLNAYEFLKAGTCCTYDFALGDTQKKAHLLPYS